MTSDNSISKLDEHLGYWLRFVSNHVSYAFTSKVEAEGVTVAEWVLMREMFDRQSDNPSQLAEQLSMTRSAISKLLDRLEQKGLAVREFSGSDRRFQTVKLTIAGKKLVPRLARLADENDRQYFGHLTEKERTVLVKLLKDLVRKHSWKDLPLS